MIPWNYPAQMFGRTIAAALAMGNACVLKPAEDACLVCLEIGRLAVEAGFPPGALNIVTGLGERAGAALTRHPDIDFISFTGSPEVGRLVQEAAAARHLPVTLELGGKSPQVVFADADLELAALTVCKAVVQNAGQTCSAGSRVLVERPIFDAFMQAVAQHFRALRIGRPEDDADLGPLINASQHRRVLEFIANARRDGLPVLAENLPDPALAGGFLRAADAVRPGAGRQPAGLPRGLRAGARGPGVRHRGRGGGARERHRVRPGRWVSGPATARASSGWPGASSRARCSSTATAPGAASSCRSAAPSAAATAARRASSRSRNSAPPRPS